MANGSVISQMVRLVVFVSLPKAYELVNGLIIIVRMR